MTEKKLRGPPITLERSGTCSDVRVVCKDGVAWAHQWLLGRHSPFLRRCFSDQATLLTVQLNQPRIPGLPATLKEWKNSAEMSQLMLPDYTTKHVNMLLDLIYTGQTWECGDIDRASGKLVILLLYEDLKIDPEYGGLPSIGDLVADLVTTPPLPAVPATFRVLPTTEDTDPPTERIPPLVIIPHPSPLVSVVASSVEHAVKEEPRTPLSSPLPDLVDLVTSTTFEDVEVTTDTYICDKHGEQNQNLYVNNPKAVPEMDNTEEVPESVNEDINIDVSTSVNESGFQTRSNSPSKTPQYESDFMNSCNEDFGNLVEEEQDVEFEVIAPAPETLSPTLSLDPLIKKIEHEIQGADCSVKLERINVKFNSHSSKRIHLQKRNSCEPLIEKLSETDSQPDESPVDFVSHFDDKPVDLKSPFDEKLSDVDSLLDGKLSDVDSPSDEVSEEKEGQLHKKRRIKIYEEDEDYILPASREKKSKVGSHSSKSQRIKSESESVGIGKTKVSKCNSKDKIIKTGNLCSSSGPDIPSDDNSGKSGNETKTPPKPERKKRKSSSPLSSKPSPKAKRRCITPDTKFCCPILNCNFSLDLNDLKRQQKHHPKIYYVLKHLISFHLRKSPCQVYADCTKVQKQCPECNYHTDSTTSLLTHMAVDHGDLSRRIKHQLAPNSLDQSPAERELYSRVDTFLQMYWEEWGQEKVVIKNDKKKSDLEESEKSSDFFSVKKVSAKREDTTSTSIVLRGGSVNGASIIREDTVRRATREKSTSVEKSVGVTSNPDTVERVILEGEKEFEKTEDSKTLICKWCSYEYTSDMNLKSHLLDQHRDKFKMIPLLEAGEKFYECDECSHRAKAKTTHMKHLQKIHKQCSLDLLQSQTSWNEKFIKPTDFCIERDLRFDYQNDGWGPTSRRIPKAFTKASSYVSPSKRGPERPPSLDLASVTILEKVFTSSDLKTRAGAPKPEGKIRSGEEERKKTGSEERSRSEADERRRSGTEYEQESPEVIEEYVSLSIPIPQRKLKRKSSHKLPCTSDNVCKICDQVFTKGPLVSTHVFYQHLQTKDNVWEDLIRDADNEGDQLPPCMICNYLPTSVLQAKLHYYNQHKRELKKEMEKKGENWAQLLEFIRYNVHEDLDNVSSKVPDEFHPEGINTKDYQEADQNNAQNQEQTAVHNIDSDTSDNHAEKTISTDINLEDQVNSSKKIDTLKVVGLSSTPETEMSNVGGEETDEMYGIDCEIVDLCFPKEICEPNTCSEKNENPSTEDEPAMDLPSSVRISAKPTSPNIEHNLPSSSHGKSSEPSIYSNISDTEVSDPLPRKSVNKNLFREDGMSLFGNKDFIEKASGESEEVKVESDAGENLGDKLVADSGETKKVNVVTDSGGAMGPQKDNYLTKPVSFDEMEVSPALIEKKASYPCTHRVGGCRKTFMDKKELHIHARICTARPQTSYHCEVEGCAKRYYYLEDYRKHFVKHHQGEGFQCLTCGAVFSTAGDILEHHNAEHK